MATPSSSALLSSLQLADCPRLFLDGGSNDGDSVRAFLSGGFYRCALNGPNRLYGAAWPKMSSREASEALAHSPSRSVTHTATPAIPAAIAFGLNHPC
eukprot:4532501-Prymnesium_polylepis.2